MSIDATAVWEVRRTGSDSNGGAYVSGAGVDYSQQNDAQLSVIDIVAGGTTTLISATGLFTANMVNNVICLSGGSGSLARTRRQITGFTNSTTITVDTGVAAGTAIIGKVGGALASLGEYGGSQADGVVGSCAWTAHVKAGTYTIAGTTVNVAGGPYIDTLGGIDASNRSRVYGYNTTRGDSPAAGSRPLFKVQDNLTDSDIIVMQSVGATDGKFTEWKWIDFDGGTGNDNTIGIHLNTNFQTVAFVKVSGTTKYGIVAFDYEELIEDFEIANFKGTGLKGLFAVQATTTIRRGSIHDETGVSAAMDFTNMQPDTLQEIAIWNVSYGMGLDHSTGCKNCTFANVSVAAIYKYDRGTSVTTVIENSLFFNCATGLYSQNNVSLPSATVTHCASGGTGTFLGTGWGSATQVSNVTLGVDPFVNLAGGDLNLNTNNPGGLQCIDTGTGGLDIGAFAATAPASTTDNSRVSLRLPSLLHLHHIRHLR